MDTPLLTTAKPSHSSYRLSERIERAIQEVPQSTPAKEAFIKHVWPKLMNDYDKMKSELVELCTAQLEGISSKVEARVKTLDSIERSIERRGNFTNVRDIIYNVHDLVALRIVVDYTPDVKNVNELISTKFIAKKEPNVFKGDRPAGNLWNTLFGAYDCTNHHVTLDPKIGSVPQTYCEVMFEIQVTSLAESLYNRLAHPALYKGSSGTCSRRDEMVIDLSHGLTLCYSICLLYMREKTEDNRVLADDPELRDDMRQAALSSGTPKSHHSIPRLVENISSLASGTGNESFPPRAASLASGSGFSPGQTIETETLLAALKPSLGDQASPGTIWSWVCGRIEEAVQDATQQPLDLPIVPRACYDSEDVRVMPTCLEGTRTSALDDISSWVDKSDEETMFWLHAPAGTGKSTLARSLAERWHSRCSLGAGYFFKRGDDERNGTARLFPTIAHQLTQSIPGFRAKLRASLKDSSKDIEFKALTIQFETLLKTPLSQLSHSPYPKVIVLDALDECQELGKLGLVVQLLGSLRELKTMRMCVFLTSRRDPLINEMFRDQPCRKMALHESYKSETMEDIEAYLKSSLSVIKDRKKSATRGWPEPGQFSFLLAQATTPTPLFIYAEVAMRFIDDPRGRISPVRRLRKWIEGAGKTGGIRVESLDQMYSRILEALTEDLYDDEKPDSTITISTILGAIATLAMPLPVNALAALLGMDEQDVRCWLGNLHAVVDVPTNPESPISVFHKSFSDYLLRDDANEENASETHRRMAIKCMDHLSRGLSKNICGLSSPVEPQFDISWETVEQNIPQDLEYACLFWTHHFVASHKLVPREEVIDLLQAHFLHWLEALSFLEKLPEGGLAIKQLQSVFLKKTTSPAELSNSFAVFLKHAERFILEHGELIRRCPLQTYGTALVFSPASSRVRQLFFGERLKCISKVEGGPTYWSPLLHSLKSSMVRDSIAISPNGQTIATHDSNSICLWDAGTGVLKQELENSENCTEELLGIAFLKDPERLVLCFHNGVIEEWDTETAAATTKCKLQGCGNLTKVAFSETHSLVATVARESELLVLWNVDTGRHHLDLDCNDWIKSVSFSPKDRAIASLTGAQIDIWSTIDGTCSKTLQVSDGSHSLAFFPDAMSLACVKYTGDGEAFQVYDLEAGTLRHSFDIDFISTTSHFMAIFPAGDRVAMTSHSGILVIWDIMSAMDQERESPSSLDTKATMSRPAAAESLPLDMPRHNLDNLPKFSLDLWLSHNQKILAAFETRDCLSLWDLESCRRLHHMRRHPGGWTSAAFSPDNTLLAVYDKGPGSLARVKLWDVATGTIRRQMTLPDMVLPRIAISIDGKLMAMAVITSDSFGEVDTGRLILALISVQNGTSYEFTFPFPSDWRYHLDSDVTGIVFSQDGKVLEIEIDGDHNLVFDVENGYTPSFHGGSNLQDRVFFDRESWIRSGSSMLLCIPERLQNSPRASSGYRAVATSTDGSLLLLDFDPEKLDQI